ncbi:uncharacterized protein LTR77_008095 [Saxophila tyrrhenica]|uniref:Uncharacterized protein n=1 Tax=Saxophila tyrrhenica TaxID=1690608 RepID=A0AAV9P2L6_9PEZI|nr:hypothetical protein LTR77_008095 [Saxophila tyrrhenica]
MEFYEASFARISEPIGLLKRQLRDSLKPSTTFSHRKECYVLVAYKETQQWWLRLFRRLAKKHGLSAEHFPSVFIIDTAQGYETIFIFVDLAV